MDLVECGTCRKVQKRFLIGKWKNGSKNYSDEYGRIWNGRKYCGLCNTIRVKESMGRLRDKRKSKEA